MIVQRTLPPTAAPLSLRDVIRGLLGVFWAKCHLNSREAELRRHFGVKHVFLVSSGKAALTLILTALGSLSLRRRVLIPAYTCFSVPSAIVKAGFEISLCDIDPTTLDFDFQSLEQSLDQDTLCVVPTHLLGLPSDVNRVKALCQGRNIFLVEDAAQAMGVKDGERFLGTLGDVGFFSFGRGKNVTCGSGGAIVTNSDDVAAAIQPLYAQLKSEPLGDMIRNVVEVIAMHALRNPTIYWLPAGLPFLKLGESRFVPDFPVCRMDGMRAALLSHWEQHLNWSNNVRHRTSLDVRRGLTSQVGVIRKSLDHPIMYLRLPILMDSKKAKEELCLLSRKHGLGISALYPTAIQFIPELQGKLTKTTFPIASMVAERLVTLPVHPLVRQEDREILCKTVNSVYEMAYLDNLCSPQGDLHRRNITAPV
jgi:dTDP-4-amino-4,6-dideoxygalactose transaminase